MLQNRIDTQTTRIKTRSFTLLEVLLALLLLSSLFAAAAFTVPRWLEESRLDRALEKVSSRIQLGQTIALSYQANLDLILSQEEKTLSLIFNAPWLQGKPFLKKACAPLSIFGVEHIALNGQESRTITLQFRPREGLVTEGKITLTGKQGTVTLPL